MDHDPIYYWRTKNNKWQEGSLDELTKAKKADAHTFKFVEVTPPNHLHTPKNVRPVPQAIHYFWAGGDIPTKLVDNMAKNAEKIPGFKSMVHIDADTPELFQAIKSKLEKDAPGLTVLNLNEDDFFQSLKTTEMYSYFRRGQGKNLSAASDVARYPLMNKYGGIYLDTDDLIKGTVGPAGLKSGDSDLLVGGPVLHAEINPKFFFNTNTFATQADNPVLNEMITEMNRRFTKNKAYFEANRPTTAKDDQGKIIYTPAFREYGRKVFETVGPTMFDDVLKSQRRDIYDIGFDGVPAFTQNNGKYRLGKKFDVEKNLREYYGHRGISAPDSLSQDVRDAKKHYGALREQLKIEVGGEHSWIDT